MSGFPVISLKSVAVAAMCSSVLALTACGGGSGGGYGGGGGGGGANAAPTAVATTSDTAPKEGQTFTLDGTGSADANNDPLTFRWTQKSGPAVTIADATLLKLAGLRVPEVTQDTAATFELSVSDGKLSSTKTVNVTFTNIHQMPRFAVEPALAGEATFAGTLEAAFPNWSLGAPTYVGFAATTGGDIALQELSVSDTGDISAVPLPAGSPPLQQPAVILSTSKISTSSNRSQFYALDEARNKVSGFIKPDEMSPFELRGGFQVNRPCAIAEIGSANRIAVGQRGTGLGLISVPPVGDTGTIPFLVQFQELGVTRSICALAPMNYPLTDAFFTDPTNLLDDLLAVDVNTNKLYAYKDDGGTDIALVTYQVREVADLDLPADAHLTLVKSLSLRNGMALLFTDGVHAGVHRLVIVGLDKDRKIVQEVHSWEIGVPKDIILKDIDKDQRPDLIVLTETSPDAIVFSAQDSGSASFLPLSDPSYLEIGLGGTLMQEIAVGAPNSKSYFMIGDREDKSVRLYGPLP
jgi:hypothetical protein